MKQKNTIAKLFHEKARRVSSSIWGAIVLDGVLPLFSGYFDPLQCSQSASDYLERLGYDPDALKDYVYHDIRVFPRDNDGFLASVALFRSSYVINRAISDPYNAVAYSSHILRTGPYKDYQFMILPEIENFEYSVMISRLSAIPEIYLKHLEGNMSPLLAAVMAHEIGHFDNPVMFGSAPEDKIKAEVFCDRYAMDILGLIETEEHYEKVFEDFRRARATGALLYALDAYEHNKVLAREQISHATALYLASEEPDYHDVYEANWRLTMRLADYNRDKNVHSPLFVRTYFSAQEILNERSDLSNIEVKILEAYIEGVEYFEKIRMKPVLSAKVNSALYLGHDA